MGAEVLEPDEPFFCLMTEEGGAGDVGFLEEFRNGHEGFVFDAFRAVSHDDDGAVLIGGPGADAEVLTVGAVLAGVADREIDVGEFGEAGAGEVGDGVARSLHQLSRRKLRHCAGGCNV